MVNKRCTSFYVYERIQNKATATGRLHLTIKLYLTEVIAGFLVS